MALIKVIGLLEGGVWRCLERVRLKANLLKTVVFDAEISWYYIYNKCSTTRTGVARATAVLLRGIDSGKSLVVTTRVFIVLTA